MNGICPLVMTNIAIEAMAIQIVSFPMKNGGSFHSYVKFPECTTQMKMGYFFFGEMIISKPDLKGKIRVEPDLWVPSGFTC